MLALSSSIGTGRKAIVQGSSSPATHADARFFVFMGVCGVGKSTVGSAVAEALSAAFVEGDALHPAENVAAMTAGKALEDTQRWPWLDAVAEAALNAASRNDRPVVVACSALRRRYRNRLRRHLPGTIFLHLFGPQDVIRARLESRTSHFMSAAMLDGQLRDLEPPEDEPDCHIIDIDRPPETVIAEAASICRQYVAAAARQSAAADR